MKYSNNSPMAAEAMLITYSDAQVEATVISNGCTHASHFSIHHTVADGHCELTIVRDKPDFCRRAPHHQTITLPWELPLECKGMDVVFTNPVLETENTVILKTLSQH